MQNSSAIPKKRQRTLGNKVSGFVSRNYLNLFSTFLILCAAFYFVQIQQLRHATLASNPELFTNGEKVSVLRVVDGDEVVIKNNQGNSRFRILGIKSFEATEKDLLLSEYGNIAISFLEKEIVGKEAQLNIANKRIDDEGRLLGTLVLTEDNPEPDVAKSMVANGLTLVYTKYPFPKMEEYLNVQSEAEFNRIGFWGNDRVAARANSMLNLWNKEQRD